MIITMIIIIIIIIIMIIMAGVYWCLFRGRASSSPWPCDATKPPTPVTKITIMMAATRRPPSGSGRRPQWQPLRRRCVQVRISLIAVGHINNEPV
jgi:hypothetical protein